MARKTESLLLSIIENFSDSSKSSNFCSIWVMDIIQENKIEVRDWSLKKAPDIKPGTQLIIYDFRRKNDHGTQIYLNNRGPIIYLPTQQSLTMEETKKTVNNLTTLDLDAECENSKVLTIQDMRIAMKKGGLGTESFYYWDNIRILQFTEYFKLSDKNGFILTKKVIGTQKEWIIETKTARVRKLTETDRISYQISGKYQCNKTKQVIFLKGFDRLGRSMFGQTANQCYYNNDDIALDKFTNKVKQSTNLGILLSFSINKKTGKNYFAVEKIYVNKEDKADFYYEEDEDENEDSDLENNNDHKEEYQAEYQDENIDVNKNGN